MNSERIAKITNMISCNPYLRGVYGLRIYSGYNKRNFVINYEWVTDTGIWVRRNLLAPHHSDNNQIIDKIVENKMMWELEQL